MIRLRNPVDAGTAAIFICNSPAAAFQQSNTETGALQQTYHAGARAIEASNWKRVIDDMSA